MGVASDPFSSDPFSADVARAWVLAAGRWVAGVAAIVFSVGLLVVAAAAAVQTTAALPKAPQMGAVEQRRKFDRIDKALVAQA